MARSVVVSRLDQKLQTSSFYYYAEIAIEEVHRVEEPLLDHFCQSKFAQKMCHQRKWNVIQRKDLFNPFTAILTLDDVLRKSGSSCL